MSIKMVGLVAGILAVGLAGCQFQKSGVEEEGEPTAVQPGSPEEGTTPPEAAGNEEGAPAGEAQE